MQSYEHKETTTKTTAGVPPTAGAGEPLGQKVSRKAGEVWEGVKESVPGTREYEATHGSTTTGTGAHTSTGAYTGASPAPPPAMHTAQNPATGETKAHQTSTGASLDQAYQDVKSKIPGTKEHKATNPTVL